MFLSKSAKRFMSTAAVLAMTVASLVVAPKVEAATGDEPTVTVKGATLKLNPSEDGQSMRIGIEVSNASQAKECGIQIGFGGKQKTISTSDAEYRKIYSIDSDTDKVVYTVVITGIPTGMFDKNFSIKGQTTPIDSEQIQESEVTSKSVKDIVDSLKASMKEEIEMSSSGQLVYTGGATLDVSSVPGAAAAGKFYLKEATAETITENNETYLKVAGTAQSGISYQFPSVVAGEKYLLEAEVKPNEDEYNKVAFSYGWTPIMEKYAAGWNTYSQVLTMGGLNFCTLTQWYGGSGFSVKSFKISKLVTSDDIKDSLSYPVEEYAFDLHSQLVTPPYNNTRTNNDDGTVTVAFKDYGYQESYLMVPNTSKDFSKIKKVIMNLENENTSGSVSYQVALKDVEGNDIDVNPSSEQDTCAYGVFGNTLTVAIPDEKVIGKIIVKNQNKEDKIVFNSITLSK